MKCVAYKEQSKGSLRGFATIEMGSGLRLIDCTHHEMNGKEWVNPPGKPMLGADKRQIEEHGKLQYALVVDFAGKAVRDNWSDQAVRAIHAERSGK